MSEQISSESTVAILKQKLKDDYGVDAPANAKKEDILKLLEDKGATIVGKVEVTTADELSQQVNEQALADQEAEKPPKLPVSVTINIPVSETDPATHVQVGLNGKAFLVQRGIDVEVPYGVFEILKNTEQTKAKMVKNEKGEQEIKYYKVPTFAISVIEKAYEQ